MESAPAKPLHILLVEDSDEDAFFFRHALNASQLHATMRHVHDGLEAIHYLQAQLPFANRTEHPFPDMIITDLNMPRADGFELLTWLRNNPSCAVIPTLVLSSSYMEPDVAKAYALGANAFLTKPSDIKQLGSLLLQTYLFWSQCQRPVPPPDLKCS